MEAFRERTRERRRKCDDRAGLKDVKAFRQKTENEGKSVMTEREREEDETLTDRKKEDINRSMDIYKHN